MLGLGNTLISDSFVGGLIPTNLQGEGQINAADNGDESVFLSLAIFTASPLYGALSTPSSPSPGDRMTGASFTLKIQRYDDLPPPNGSGTVQSESTGDVFFYFANDTGFVFRTYYMSPVEASSLDPVTFESGGSSRFDLSSYGSPATDITASNENLYVFTLTGQADGYEEFVNVSAPQTIEEL